MKKRQKKPVKSNLPPNFEILRGIFSGPELEACLWESVWLDWDSGYKKTDKGSFSNKPLRLLDIGLNLREAVIKMTALLPHKNNDVVVWMEKHVEGDHCKLSIPAASGYVVMLSLGQFRGGRTYVGDFKGYINPGEVLSVKITKGSAPYQVEKISSGERVVLCIGQKDK